jgi:hypothetical protein
MSGGPWEKYAAQAATPATPTADAAPTADAGPWTKYAAAAPAATPGRAAAGPALPDRGISGILASAIPRSLGDAATQFAGGTRDALAGALRGAGSIGATLLTPTDLLTGQTKSWGNPERRQAITDALQSLGANPDSWAFKAAKLGGEVAGTAGVGGTLAAGARAVPILADAAPALASGGMSAGGAQGAAGLALRTLGGAATGGASAALVNPDDAMIGALTGAAMPGVGSLLAKGGAAAAKALKGAEIPADHAAAVSKALDAGYTIPPTQIQPTALNRTVEGLAGKVSTAQAASARNAGITNAAAARDLGLAADTKITPEVLAQVRADAGKAYDAIANSGTVVPTPAYGTALDAIVAPAKTAAAGFPNAKVSPVVRMVDSLRSPQFDAASAVEKIKELRTTAADGFRTGDTATARAAKAGAQALEDALETHLAATDPGALDAFRQARQTIAKSYTVEQALNPATGDVNAQKLAAALARGKPLTGELKDAAEFAARFPKASQPPAAIGSQPGMSPLDFAIAAATPHGFTMKALATYSRPAARSVALSSLMQRAPAAAAAAGAGAQRLSYFADSPTLSSLARQGTVDALSDQRP